MGRGHGVELDGHPGWTRVSVIDITNYAPTRCVGRLPRRVDRRSAALVSNERGVPLHVPQGLVHDFDHVTGPEVDRDPFAVYRNAPPKRVILQPDARGLLGADQGRGHPRGAAATRAVLQRIHRDSRPTQAQGEALPTGAGPARTPPVPPGAGPVLRTEGGGRQGGGHRARCVSGCSTGSSGAESASSSRISRSRSPPPSSPRCSGCRTRSPNSSSSGTRCCCTTTTIRRGAPPRASRSTNTCAT